MTKEVLSVIADGTIGLLGLPRGMVLLVTTSEKNQISLVLGEETDPIRNGYGVGRLVTVSSDWLLTSTCFGRLGEGASIHVADEAGDLLFQGARLVLENPTGTPFALTVKSVAVQFSALAAA